MRIVNVVGSSRHLVKIFPLINEMRRHPSIVPIVVYTGLHPDGTTSQPFFTELEILPPDFTLGIGPGSHAAETAEVVKRLEPFLEGTRPDLVLVVGDGNPTLAASLTAVKLGISVGHLQAGLRSFDRSMPQEINRLVTDAIADLLFVTEDSGRKNLLREGIAPEKIHLVGNVSIEALQMFRPRWEGSSIFNRLELDADRPYGIITCHRASKLDDPVVLMNFLDMLHALSRHFQVIFLVHPPVKSQVLRQGYLFWTRPGGGGSVHPQRDHLSRPRRVPGFRRTHEPGPPGCD